MTTFIKWHEAQVPQTMPNWQCNMCGQLVKMGRMFTLKVCSGPVGCALLIERVVVIRITCGYIHISCFLIHQSFPAR